MTKDAFVLVFCKEHAESIVIATKRTVRNGKIIEKDGMTSKCHVCSKEMNTDNLGRILPGSTLLCCDDPLCFNSFSVDLV